MECLECGKETGTKRIACGNRDDKKSCSYKRKLRLTKEARVLGRTVSSDGVILCIECNKPIEEKTSMKQKLHKQCAKQRRAISLQLHLLKKEEKIKRKRKMVYEKIPDYSKEVIVIKRKEEL